MNTAKRNPAWPLAFFPDPQTRMDICDNSNTPLAIRLLLARDENPDVRYALAENHNIPEIVLNLLTQDAHPYVADRARRTLARLQGSARTPYTFRAA